MKITVLGCGASGGVPLIGDNWGDCDRSEPRNRRRRSSILIEGKGATILVDASPDCRAQLLDAGTAHLDAVIFTHAHADHIHGIDDLRWVNVAMGAAIPTYAYDVTLEQINTRFGYVFAPLDHKARGHFYKPCLDPRPVGDGSFRIGELEIRPFRQDHGFSTTMGLRVEGFAYSVDVVALDEPAFERLYGVDNWIVGCLGRAPHPTHAHVDKVLEWIERVGPTRAWLSHMSHTLDYAALCEELPGHVRPAHDGLTIEV